MKKSNIALLLLFSLGVVACGSSSNSSNSPKVEDKPTQITPPKTESSEIANLKSEIANLRNRLAQLSSDSAQSSQVAELQNQLNQTKSKLDKADKAKNDEIEKLKTQIKNAETALSNAKTENQATIELLKEKIKKAEADLSNAQKASNSEIDRLKAQIATTEKALSDTQATNQAEIAKLSAEIESTKALLVQKEKALNEKLNSGSWRYLGNKPNNPESVGIERTAGDLYIDLSTSPVSDEIVRIPVLRDNQEVGTSYFINQRYSSFSNYLPKEFMSWEEAEKQPFVSAHDYVFLPTNPNQSELVKNDGSATYQGKTLERNYTSETTNEGNVTSAKFSLTANFADKTVNGSITERESSRPDIQLKTGSIYENLTQLGDADQDFGHLGFKGEASSFRKNGTERVGKYVGFFAGPNAEEVVGYVEGQGGDISFGGKR